MNDQYAQMEDLQRHWSPPPELRSATPRSVVLGGPGIALAVLAGLLMIGALAAVIGLQRVRRNQVEENRLFREEAAITEARVTRHWRDSSKENHPMVAYEFEWQGRTYSGKARVPKHVWTKLAVGSPFEVRFLPGDPARNRARDWGNGGMPQWVPYFLGAIFAGAGVMIVGVLRRLAQLLREGRPAPGVITGYSKGPKGEQTVHYQFRQLSGAVTKGKSGPTHQRKLPAVGSTVCVVYDRDNPKRSALYPMSMVRIEKV